MPDYCNFLFTCPLSLVPSSLLHRLRPFDRFHSLDPA